MGPLDDQVVRADSLTATPDGLDIAVYSHWYRALPLTSLAVVDLAIDGEPVPAEQLEVEANGKTFRFDELAERWEEWWFTTDAVTLLVPRADAEPGTRHRVELDLGLLIPYLIVGPGEGEPLLASSHTDKTLVARSGQ